METSPEPDKTAPKKARKGRTASKAVRREQLIEATIGSIAKRCFSSTTMTTVTGLSVGIVNVHFNSKENLFEETLRFLATEHRQMWLKAVDQQGVSAAQKLLAIVDAEFHPQICNRKKLTVWSVFYEAAGYRTSCRTIMTDIDNERFGTSAKLCKDIIDRGGFDRQPPCRNNTKP